MNLLTTSAFTTSSLELRTYISKTLQLTLSEIIIPRVWTHLWLKKKRRQWRIRFSGCPSTPSKRERAKLYNLASSEAVLEAPWTIRSLIMPSWDLP